jgi:hypothetical protein
MADNLGFDSAVVADATATFDRETHDGRRIDAEANHRAALAHLHGEFADVATTDDVLSRDVRGHPRRGATANANAAASPAA